MIKVGSGDISKIMLGEVPVSKVYRGSEVVWSASKQYGGIEVLFDDAAYQGANGLIDQYSESTDRFIAEPVYAGGIISITVGYDDAETPRNLVFRCFNDLSLKSNDYWSINVQQRTLTTQQTYLVFTIEKSKAGHFFVYDNTNQKYLLKGSAVE